MTSTPTFFFTADEHYGHTNIIRYCDRPFGSVEEMDTEIIERHNKFVGSQDVVIHAGDFTLAKKPIERLSVIRTFCPSPFHHSYFLLAFLNQSLYIFHQKLINYW